MKYQIIVEEGSYALILRGNKLQQYAVVNGLDKETGEWAFTCSYYDFGPEFKRDQADALMLALDIFLCKVRYQYISRSRLEELAFKSIYAGAGGFSGIDSISWHCICC